MHIPREKRLLPLLAKIGLTGAAVTILFLPNFEPEPPALPRPVDLLALVQSNSLPLTMNASDTSVIAR